MKRLLIAAAAVMVSCAGPADEAPATVGNPFLPMWEHIPDGEPYVFEDPDNPGVLLLSCHTGAAEQMQQALIVNPHDIKSLKDALSKALDMPLSERMIRYHALIKDLDVNDIHAWRTSFLADLSHANTGHLHEV